MTRVEFIGSLLASSLGAALPSTMDFTFAGRVAVVAQRLRDGAPIIAYHADDAFASASIIKLLIAVAVTQNLAQTDTNWSDLIQIQKQQIVAASETFEKVAPGTAVTYAALLSAMIAQSDNTAANVLLDRIGFENVNYLAAQVGLPQTKIARHFMDFAARKAGHENITCAADMARLTRLIASDPVKYQRIIGAMMSQEDRELIPASIERAVIIANKTGTLPDVRHDVAIVGFNSPAPYVLAILSSGFTDMKTATTQIRNIAAQVDAAMSRSF